MIDAIKIDDIRALNDYVLVADMNFNERLTSGGIVLMNDDSRGAGIRPRWAQVYAIGPEQTTIKVGQWILVNHGRWTRGVKIEDSTGEHTIRRIDSNDVLLVSDTEPADDTQSEAVSMDSKTRW
jgi:hypothetical protein